MSAGNPRPKDAAHLRQISRDTWEGVEFLQKELQSVEGQLDVGMRWTPDSAEYQNAVKYLSIRTYQRAVDKLEGLVVQRLFELTKANVSQTGKFYFGGIPLLTCSLRLQATGSYI